MKKFVANVGQPTADPSVDMPPADSPSETDPPTDQEHSVQLSPSLPPEIKYRLFVSYRPNIASIDRGEVLSWGRLLAGAVFVWVETPTAIPRRHRPCISPISTRSPTLKKSSLLRPFQRSYVFGEAIPGLTGPSGQKKSRIHGLVWL